MRAIGNGFPRRALRTTPECRLKKITQPGADIRVFEELRGLGYEGSYDAVRRYAKVWAKEQGAATAEAYVPLSFSPGEAYQFDWSHEVVLINGVTSIVKVAHFRLCHSRMLPARPCRAELKFSIRLWRMEARLSA